MSAAAFKIEARAVVVSTAAAVTSDAVKEASVIIVISYTSTPPALTSFE
jgi:hypothetical protein